MSPDTAGRRRPHVRAIGFSAGLVLLALAAAPGAALAAGGPAGMPSPEISAEAAKAAAGSGRAPSLAEILTATETLEVSERSMRRRMADGTRIEVLAAEIEAVQSAFPKADRLLTDASVDMVEYYDLVDLAIATRASDRRLTAATEALVARAQAFDTDLDRLARYETESAMWLQAARARNAPPAVLDRIQAIPRRSGALARDLRADRDRTLQVLDRATQLRGEVRALLAEASDRRTQLEVRMQAARGEPIWRIAERPEAISRVKRFVRTEIALGVRHLRENATRLLAIVVAAFLLSYWLIRGLRGRLTLEAEPDRYTRLTVNLFQAPMAAALVLSLLALVWLGPAGPTIYYPVLISIGVIPALLLVRAALRPRVPVLPYVLAGAMIPSALLGALIDPLPLASRLFLIGQCVAVAIALGVDLRRGYLGQVLPTQSPRLVRGVVRGIGALLALAVAASIMGEVGASRILRNAVLGSLVLVPIIAIAAHLVDGLIVGLMQTRAARSLRIIRLQPSSVRRAIRTVLVTAGLLAWAAFLLLGLGVLGEAANLAERVVGADIEIGAASISMAGVLTGLAVLLGTYVLVKVLRLVLEVEVLPRLNLREGIPFAVSAVTRYALLTGGVVLAMAAMGIDLSKVTLLAGAVGVGIGFGLQTVINNFVSGLLLLMERPIRIGDAVRMDDLEGEVRRIGVRSSTIRTFDGAEVIVPNSDLISRTVTNWTLSDRKRRLQIDVGVAYGTEPEDVVQLLEAAAREVKEVMVTPEPRAWVTGFGDSSLNFRLHAWVDDWARGLAGQSALRMAIARKLKEAGIEIPFPQHDIHIRSASGPPVAPMRP
jgi:small-conductance mechanosensitive channel